MRAAVLTALLPLAAWAQPSQALTADQIIEKSIAATGGREALARLSSSMARGVMEIGPQHVHSTVEFYAKAPNRRLIVTNIEGFGEIRQGFDGRVAWSVDPMRGLREFEGAELADARRDATFNAELKWRELYPKIELLGKEKVNGGEAWAVRLTSRDGHSTNRYYDAGTFLLVRQVTRRSAGDARGELRVDLSDYRDVGGVKAPFLIRQNIGEVVITMVEIRNNVEIDDAKFAKPLPADLPNQ